MDAFALLEGAGGGAGAEADVPHGLGAGADLVAIDRLDLVVGAEEEDIDVGAGKELAAPETSGGDEGDVFLGIHGSDVVPELAQEGADHLRAAANCG